MTDDLALVLVIAVLAGICWLPRLTVWRRCRCGAQYCNGCNAKRGKLWDAGGARRCRTQRQAARRTTRRA